MERGGKMQRKERTIIKCINEKRKLITWVKQYTTDDVAKSIVPIRPSVHVKEEHRRKIKEKRDNANKNMLIRVNVCCNDTTLNIMYNESYSDE